MDWRRQQPWQRCDPEEKLGCNAKRQWNHNDEEWVPSDDMKWAAFLVREITRAGGSRQVVAASASAMWRLCASRPDSRPMEHIKLQEEILATVEQELGVNTGIGKTCKVLKMNGYDDIAHTISNVHRSRVIAAHPPVQVVERLKGALKKMQD